MLGVGGLVGVDDRACDLGDAVGCEQLDEPAIEGGEDAVLVDG
jgi:hypothetical protein